MILGEDEEEWKDEERLVNEICRNLQLVGVLLQLVDPLGYIADLLDYLLRLRIILWNSPKLKREIKRTHVSDEIREGLGDGDGRMTTTGRPMRMKQLHVPLD